MNEELEKNFLEEIKPLIDEYVEYTNKELPDYSSIMINTDREYANDQEGKILQDLDEELAKLVASKIDQIKQLREKNAQEKQEAIYSEAQEFVATTKEEMDKQIEEKNKKLQEKKEAIDESISRRKDIEGKLKKLKNAKIELKDVDENVYKALDTAEQEKMKTLIEECKSYNKLYEEQKSIQDELSQLEEERDSFEKTYSEIDFESEKGISDIVSIIESKQEKDEHTIPEEDEISSDNVFGASENYARITSLKDLEEKRQKKDGKEQEDEKSNNTKFPRINPDEVQVGKPKKILTMDDLKDEEEQGNNEQDSDEIADEDAKRKQEEEKMWEEYETEQEKQEEKAKKETYKKLEEHEQKIAKDKEKHDKAEEKFYENLEKEKEEFNEEEEKRQEEEQKIRKRKEKFFNSKEKGYEDLLKDDNAYQALKESLITKYKLYKLKEALEDKSLTEIYTLYVKQVEKNIEDSLNIEENLTGEELDKVIMERLDNQDLFETLRERLEKLKEREKELGGPEPKSEPQPQPQPQPQPEAYEETKIVVEPYKDTVTVYLKGHTEPFICDDLKQRIEDGKNLAKSNHIQKGLIKGIQKGDAAILSILQEIEIVSGYELIDGYTWMYAKSHDIAKDNHPSLIDEIVYDFSSNENDKIQDKKIIKEMQKYAKEAEKNEVAESIGRKKGIPEKAKDVVTGLFGKGKEKVLALGEGIKSKNPIEGVKKKINDKKYYTPKEVDESKATGIYNEWKQKMGNGAPTQEEQADFMQVFKDRSEQERESEKVNQEKQDKFYGMYK